MDFNERIKLVQTAIELKTIPDEIIKDTALKLMPDIASIKHTDIDTYFESAIITAYRFEKYWRSREWEKLLEKEQKEEI